MALFCRRLPTFLQTNISPHARSPASSLGRSTSTAVRCKLLRLSINLACSQSRQTQRRSDRRSLSSKPRQRCHPTSIAAMAVPLLYAAADDILPLNTVGDPRPPQSQTLPESISILTFTSLLFTSDDDYGPSHPFIQSICACPNGCSYQFPGSGGRFVFLSSIPKLCELNCCFFQVRSSQAAEKAFTYPLRRSTGRGSVGSVGVG